MTDIKKSINSMHTIGLIFGCPFESEVIDCPFLSLRKEKDKNERYIS